MQEYWILVQKRLKVGILQIYLQNNVLRATHFAQCSRTAGFAVLKLLFSAISSQKRKHAD